MMLSVVSKHEDCTTLPGLSILYHRNLHIWMETEKILFRAKCLNDKKRIFSKINNKSSPERIQEIKLYQKWSY